MGKWLDERKNILFRDLVNEYFDNHLFFEDVLEVHNKTGHVPYSMMEHWVGSEAHKGKLWALKDRCHRLLRGDKGQESILEYLFDWTIGSIFHQCIKLKEDVYQLEAYAPQHERLSNRDDPSGNLAGVLKEMEQRMQTVRASLISEMEQAVSLFRTADDHLLRILTRHTDNTLLIRFFIQNRNKVEHVYGKGSLDHILITMYPAGRHEAYYMAGMSYLEGGWYEEAIYFFQTGLAMAPGHDGLRKALAEARIREEQNKEKVNG